MPARGKGPQVKPEKRQEWLERSENGESPPQISASDGFDVRTVRKHIDIARQEREVKEARSSVLRNALERHYADLCRYAERLVEDRREMRLGIDATPPEASPYEPEIGTALRQHIPRSVIWKLLSQETKLRSYIADLTKEFETKIESAISSDSRLVSKLTSEESGVIPGIVTALKGQSRQWFRGWASLTVKDNLKPKRTEDGFVDLSYGSYGLGKVRIEHVDLIGDTITDWTARLRESEEVKKLEKLLLELDEIRKRLRDEVAVIVLRRVVPGRCRYCPLQG